MTDSTETFELASDVEQHTDVFMRAFNSGRMELIEQLFDPEAVFVPEPGKPVTGAEILRRTEEFLALGVPLSATARHIYQAGDTALLIVDWVIDGTGSDGSPVHMTGTATDVVRRGADGRWRYLVDSPHGTATVD